MAQTRTEALLHLMDQTFSEEGWYVPLAKAVEGVSAAQAAWISPAGGNSIRQIVSHVTFWKEYFMNRIQGKPKPEGEFENTATFGEPGDPADEGGWADLVARLIKVQGELRDLASGDAALDRSFGKVTVGRVLSDMAGHDAYHAGQVMVLRKQQGSWEAVR